MKRITRTIIPGTARAVLMLVVTSTRTTGVHFADMGEIIGRSSWEAIIESGCRHAYPWVQLGRTGYRLYRPAGSGGAKHAGSVR